MIRLIRRIGPIGLILATFALAAMAAEPPAPKLREVIVVFKTHFDIGYTDLARNVVNHYRTGMIDRALAVCDETRSLPPEQRFVWTIPGWPMTQILGPQQTPERRQRILDAVRDGRFVWHALPFTTHTESLDLEDLVRGMHFSSALARALGRPLPRGAKMTDVTCHTWLLPTLLRHAGVEFLHLGCNAACPMPDVPQLFWWEGPDGSRLLTMYAGDYGTGLTPPRGWPHATWLALIHTGDNQGPPSTADVRALLARAARDLPGVRVRMGELSDFADAILRENPDLPVIRADMPDTWIQGIMSMPQETGIARNARPAIAALESLNTLLRIWGVDVPSAAATVAAAYEQSLLYGEHTWGIDFKRFGRRLYGAAFEAAHARGTYKLAEESWAEHGSYARRAESLTTPALAANLDALARAVSIAGPRLVVFNPLPWERSGFVNVAAPAGSFLGLADAETHKPVPVERIGDRLRFLADAVPAMGYRTYIPSNAPPEGSKLRLDRANATMENEHLSLRLDPARGTIAGLQIGGSDLVDPACPYGLGQYLYERFDTDQIKSYLDDYLRQRVDWAKADLGRTDLPSAKEAPRVAASPKGFALEFREGPVSITATMRAPASDAVPHAVAIAVTVYRERAYVDIECTITGKRPDPWPETGWLCFPFAVDRPRFEVGRVGSFVDPAADFRKSTNRDILCLNTGVRMTGQDMKGVVLCPLDSPLVSLERPGLWRFSRDFVPTKPAVFVNLFNNAIATNFQQWWAGTLTSRVRIWSARPGSPAWQDLGRPSWETRSPLRAGFFDAPAGPLPPTRTGITVESGGVLVTAFGPNPDGEGTLLRLWEQSGESGSRRVRLPDGLRARQAQPVDLRGQPAGDPIPVRDNSLEVPLPRFAPVSLLLKGD